MRAKAEAVSFWPTGLTVYSEANNLSALAVCHGQQNRLEDTIRMPMWPRFCQPWELEGLKVLICQHPQWLHAMYTSQRVNDQIHNPMITLFANLRCVVIEQMLEKKKKIALMICVPGCAWSHSYFSAWFTDHLSQTYSLINWWIRGSKKCIIMVTSNHNWIQRHYYRWCTWFKVSQVFTCCAPGYGNCTWLTLG